MHYAAAFAKEDIVKALLNRKADITLTGGVRKQKVLVNDRQKCGNVRSFL